MKARTTRSSVAAGVGVLALALGVGACGNNQAGDNVVDVEVTVPEVVEVEETDEPEADDGGEDHEGTPEAAAPAAPAGHEGACDGVDSISLDTFVNWDPAVISGFEQEYGTTVTQHSFAQSTDLQTAMLSGLAVGGTGVGDVVTIEGDQWSAAMINPDDFIELPEIPGRWLDWAEEEGMAGGVLRGYRTDIGPVSVLFNARLLEDQGFGDRATVEGFDEWIGGPNATWDDYLNAGREWHEATGLAWVDSISDGPLRAALRQLPAAFEDPATGEPLDLATNTQVHDIFMQMGDAMQEGLGAGAPFWNEDWGAAMLGDEFVTMVAPPWQIGWPLMANGAGVVDGDWRVASVFPEDGANWGGTFIAVTAHSQHQACGIALADWLTNDQTAVAQWEAEGAFPSQAAVLNAGLADAPETRAFLGDQDYSAVLTDLAERIPSATYRGRNFSWIQDDAIFENLAQVQDGLVTPSQAWDNAVATFNAHQ